MIRWRQQQHRVLAVARGHQRGDSCRGRGTARAWLQNDGLRARCRISRICSAMMKRWSWLPSTTGGANSVVAKRSQVCWNSVFVTVDQSEETASDMPCAIAATAVCRNRQKE